IAQVFKWKVSLISQFYHEDQYSTMKNDDAKDDQFIIGFANPMMESTNQDREDGNIKALAYRPFDTDAKPTDKDGDLLQSKFLFPREKLTFGPEIGTAWFGKVYKGEATRIVPGLRKTKVIIKKLREDSTSEQRKRFLDEIAMFRSLNHENVLETLGHATERQPYIVVFEYNPLGNLKEYLKSHRTDAVSIKQRLIPLKMSIDIGSGLEFLHSKRFYHSDLATRNCIVNSDLTVKIGDYGISRDLYQGDYYKDPKLSEDSLPIRWLDPESVCCDKDSGLSVKPPTAKENVWSYGITLWEIVEFGRQPYEELTDEEVLQSVILDRLYQLPEPKETGILASQLYDMMKWCWTDPTRRPSIEDMVSFLRDLLENIPELLAESECPEVQAVGSTVNQYKQPVAVVRPLRHSVESEHKQTVERIQEKSKKNPEASSNSTILSSHTEEVKCINEGGDVQVTAICDDPEQVPVTVIHSESSQENELRKDYSDRETTPVTYIGGPSDGLTEYERRLKQGTQEVIHPSKGKIVEVKYSGCDPSVIVESCSSGYVVLPGGRLRRKSSLRQAHERVSINSDISRVVFLRVGTLWHGVTVTSRGHTVHFPANILDLRVVHRYHREDDEDGGEVSFSGSPPSNNLSIELESQDEPTTSQSEDKRVPGVFTGPQGEEATEIGNALILERPISPVEKRVKKAARRKQLNRNADEWLFSIDQEH
ncbi:hypothetical protein QZH41_019063, partial [Actinostola sp. cb2023]